jgi:hypothetical protein
MTPTDRDLERAQRLLKDAGVMVACDKRGHTVTWPGFDAEIAAALTVVRSEERAAVLGRLTEDAAVEAGASAVDELIVPFHTRADAVVFARAALAAVAALLGEP